MATNEELQQELDSLRQELRQLRASIERLPAPKAEPGRTLSRRNLLRVAPIAAVGTAMAVMSAGPAAAAEGDPVLQGKQNDAGPGKTTTITGGTDLPVEGVPAGSPAAVAYTGGLSGDWLATNGVAVGLDTGAALSVGASYLRGLAAHFAGPGVPTSHGQSGADAVLIDCTGPGTALIVRVQDGDSTPPGFPEVVLPAIGISVDSRQGNALRATSEQTTVNIVSTGSTGKDAVTVACHGTGRALFAESLLSTNAAGAVTGVNHGHGSGVQGVQSNNSSAGFGVLGVAGTHGRGGQFSGGAAPVRLVPSAAHTHPTTGKAGDLFVDGKARLWFCNKTSTIHIPAGWKRIA